MAESPSTKEMTVTREELYAQVWTTPMHHLAARYGISGNGLAKICDRLNVPYPPRGYWAKRAAKKDVHRTPLPPDTVRTPKQATIYPTPPRSTIATKPAMDDALRLRHEAALKETASLRVSTTLRQPHPAIAVWLAEHERHVAIARDNRGNSRDPLPKLSELDKRRMRVLDTLFKELEKRDFKVNQETYQQAWVQSGGRDQIEFSLYEHVRQFRRPLAGEERKSPFIGKQKFRQEHVPTGKLVFKIRTHLETGIPQEWRDDETHELEQHIAEIVASFLVAQPILAERRKQAEERERQHWEAERRRSEEAARKKRDHNRCLKFLDLAKQWRDVQLASEFLSILEERAASEKKFGKRSHAEWITWMRQRLEIYDPLTVAPEGIWQDIAAVTEWDGN